MADLYINYGSDGEQMVTELLKEAQVEKQLHSSMKVVLKPNLVVSRPASQGATTHPEIVEGILRYLLEAGVTDIVIAEGSWVGDSTKAAFRECGYNRLSKEYGVKLVDTKSDKLRKVSSHNQSLAICETLLEADYLINIPVLKAHCQTGITCCLKNMKGCIPDSEKRRYHSQGLHEPIAALSAALRPQLHIVDSICGDLTFEEGGNPVQTDRILLGYDGVLVDSYCAELLGYRPEEITHLRLAAGYGAGKLWNDSSMLVELNPHNRPQSAPQVSRIAKKLGEFVEEDCACSACYASLLFALHKSGGIAGERVKVGQGFRGQSLEGMGVGNCTKGCTLHVPGCPPKAADIVDALEKWH